MWFYLFQWSDLSFKGSYTSLLFVALVGDSGKVTTVVATPGQGPDRPQEVAYTDIKVIGNGSFGVVYQARLIDSQEMVAIKKVLQDKRFKVGCMLLTQKHADPNNYSVSALVILLIAPKCLHLLFTLLIVNLSHTSEMKPVTAL